MKLEEVKLYRMTHISNIPHILRYGITHKNSADRNPDFIPIGDSTLIHTRQSKQVKVDNGAFLDLNAPSIILGDFIPFYFGVKMPMLYVIQNGGNFVHQATPAWDIVYLVCSVSRICEAYSNYYFSDGHATDSLTTFYDRSRIDDLPRIIDWNAVKASYWGGQENLNIKRKKQAEFLIQEDISPAFILGYGCYNNTAWERLTGSGISSESIKIIPNAYY
jgi:ssDNA thymidine ADP-ribosyltransferase, DarT